MKTVMHRAQTRGYANHGWLKSYHSFSFASYQNPDRMNFGRLRVLNDDIVQPKMGFGTHPHQNMEIISIPLKGALSHQDSMNNKRAIKVGEVQVMSAGSGLTHSEFNDSNTDNVNFLQLWILPEEMGVKPSYEQRQFDLDKQKNKLQTVVAPKNALLGKSLPIHQQAYIYRSNLEEGRSLSLQSKAINNGFYVFLTEGELKINNQVLSRRDALGIWETETIEIKATKDSELIIVEVPMG